MVLHRALSGAYLAQVQTGAAVMIGFDNSWVRDLPGSFLRLAPDGAPAPVLVAMAKRLEGAGAMALAMPCNTAHHYASDIRAAVNIPFLDMVAASARAALAVAGLGGKVGLLASPAVAKVGLFDGALAALGLEVVHPADGAALLDAIREIKAHGPTDAARAALQAASGALLAKGAKVQLIACTEFSLIADAVAPGARAIDTLDVLVNEIVGFARASA